MPEEETVFVNTPMTAELRDMLDEMAGDNDQSRAAFIRQLIRKEYAARERAKAKQEKTLAA